MLFTKGGIAPFAKLRIGRIIPVREPLSGRACAGFLVRLPGTRACALKSGRYPSEERPPRRPMAAVEAVVDSVRVARIEEVHQVHRQGKPHRHAAELVPDAQVDADVSGNA